MNRYKKYILLIFFLFSTANALPSVLLPILDMAVRDISTEYITVAKIIIGIKIISCITNHLFLELIFKKKHAARYIEQHGTIIRIILKLLFFTDSTAQHSYISWIKKICLSKKYPERHTEVKFLLSSGVNPRFSTGFSPNLLTSACRNSNTIELVQYLLENSRVNPNGRDQKTVWFLQILRFLNNGSGPDIWNEDLIHDSLAAACYNNNIQAVKLLIKHNTHTHPFLDINHTEAPILLAIQHSNTEMFKDLFAYTVEKTKAEPKIYKVWLLKHIMELKDIYNIVAKNFIDLSPLIKPHDALIDSCFTCNEKIWLPHKYNLYSGKSKAPYRLDINPTFESEWHNKREKERIRDIKTKVKAFLPRLQISR